MNIFCEAFRKDYEETLERIRSATGLLDRSILLRAKILGDHRKECKECDLWAKQFDITKKNNNKKKKR